MAALKNHGANQIVKFIWYKKAYCSDGVVLIDRGWGWKKFSTLKPGFDWKDVAKRKQDSVNDFYYKKPAFAELVYWLDEHVPSYKKRAYLKTALETLYDDPDGLWSELNDHSYHDVPHLDLSDVLELCRRYKAALVEGPITKGRSSD